MVSRWVALAVGGGVAGLEIAMCLQTRLKHRCAPEAIRISIVTAGAEVGDGLKPKSIKKLRRLLAERDIDVWVNQRVEEICGDTVVLSDGTRLTSPCVIRATSAEAPSLLQNLELPTDARGFIETKATLQSVEDPRVFAVGDSGSIVGARTAKAGVYAVRQAPILWHNLKALLAGQPLREYRPQSNFLKILNTGDGSALLEYKSLCVHAAWCLKLKMSIDKRFIGSYQR